MNRRLKISAILFSVVLLAVLAMSIGLSAALWADVGGEGTYAPQADTTDWNAWTKYFTYEEVIENGSVVSYAVSGYSGVNLQDVIFPKSYNGRPVTEIRNTVFASNTLKQLPVSIKIPSNIVTIDPSAFCNLSNLQRVTFAAYDENATAIEKRSCVGGANLFSGCQKLSSIEIMRGVSFSDFSFLSCASLTNAGIVTSGEGTVSYSPNAKLGSALS